MSNSKSGGITLDMVLFIVFLVLKLTHVIDWSWWWVTSPLWIPLVIIIVLLIFLGLIKLIE
jgi:hypothetical protein